MEEAAGTPEPKFGGLRPLSNAASIAGRGDAQSSKSLHSKLHEAFAEPANRGILEAAITVERIQKLRGRFA